MLQRAEPEKRSPRIVAVHETRPDSARKAADETEHIQHVDLQQVLAGHQCIWRMHASFLILLDHGRSCG